MNTTLCEGCIQAVQPCMIVVLLNCIPLAKYILTCNVTYTNLNDYVGRVSEVCTLNDYLFKYESDNL